MVIICLSAVKKDKWRLVLLIHSSTFYFDFILLLCYYFLDFNYHNGDFFSVWFSQLGQPKTSGLVPFESPSALFDI